MVVYSIIPSDEDSDCNFVGADGNVIRINGGQQDIIPQPLVSVTCVARSGPVVTPTGFPNFTSFFPNLQTVATNASVASNTVYSATKSGSTAAITSSAAGTGPSTIPPYPTGTGSTPKASAISASASAPPGTTKSTGGSGTSTTVPFTGNAVRAARSLCTSLLAFVGLIAVL